MMSVKPKVSFFLILNFFDFLMVLSVSIGLFRRMVGKMRDISM